MASFGGGSKVSCSVVNGEVDAGGDEGAQKALWDVFISA